MNDITLRCMYIRRRDDSHSTAWYFDSEREINRARKVVADCDGIITHESNVTGRPDNDFITDSYELRAWMRDEG